MHYDVIVVGLGAFGAATLYQLAKRGVRVAGLDRYSPPHGQGSSHGDTRITRQAIGEGAAYVPLALNAHRIWRELEAASGVPLFQACGMLMLSDSRAATRGHGTADFAGQTAALARTFGIPHSRWTRSRSRSASRSSPVMAHTRWAISSQARAMCGRKAPLKCSSGWRTGTALPCI